MTRGGVVDITARLVGPPRVAALVTLAMKWGPYENHRLRDTLILEALRDLEAWKDQG